MNELRTVAAARAAGNFHRIPISRLPYLALLLSGLLALAFLASAQTDLYGPEAPRDVAYVRFLNAASSDPITPLAGEFQGEALGFGQISDYQPFQPGDIALSLGEHEAVLTAEAESFHTVVALADELLLLEDEPLRDISRGILNIYNLDPEATISLATEDGTVVFEEVAPLSADGVQIAEAEVALLVLKGDETVTALESKLYGRGQAHSVIVLPLGSDPQVVVTSAGAEP